MIRHIINRELHYLVRQPLMWFCMIVAPLVIYVFFTTIMGEGLPKNLPLGVVDLDNSSTSRNLVRNLDAFQMTNVEHRYATITEARRALQEGDIYGFYYIPRHVAKKANRQETPIVSFYTNYSFLVAGSLLYKDQRMMSELASGAAMRSVLRAKGSTDQQAMAFLQPIVIDTHPIGNPWLNYNVYLSNTLIPGVLMLFIFMVTVFSLGMEVKHGTGSHLLEMANGNIIKAISAKLLPHTIIWMAMGSIYVTLLYGILHFPCNSGLWPMYLVMMLMVIASQSMGVFMFSCLPTPRMGLSFASLWGVMSFSISGMSFPVMAMHPTIQGLSYLFPLRHYFILYVNCALDGYPLINAWPYVVFLFMFPMAALIVLPRLKYSFLHYAYAA